MRIQKNDPGYQLRFLPDISGPGPKNVVVRE